MITGEDLAIWKPEAFFRGYTIYTYIVIVIFVAVGLSTSVLLKYLSAILKEFASASEMVTIALFGNLFFGDSIKLSFELILSIILIFYSLYLYNYEKFGLEPKGDIENQKR